MTDAGARASLERTLSRAARRLWTQRLLASLPAALAGGLAGPALALLLPHGAPGRAMSLLTPLLAAAVLAFRTLRTPSRTAAAAWLDRRGHLADTLTTACWFLDHPRDDPWVRHQGERAAEAGRALDLEELVALRVPPGPAVLAAALALVVAAAARGPRGPAPGRRAAAVADATTERSPRSQPPSDPEAETGRDARVDGLPAPADLEALAEELRRGLDEDIRERLEEMARRAEGARPRGAEDGPGEGDEEGSARALTGEELAAALAEAARAMESGDREDAARALEEAAEAAEAREQQGAEPPSPGQSRQAGAQEDTAAKAPAEAGVRWSLDALDPQSLEEGDAQQAARGDAAGPPSGGGEPEEGEATELEVELERETLASESARETEPTEVTEEASREQGARVGYRGGEGGRYQTASPQEGARVPWPDRERVRLYLLALTREETQR